MSIAGPRGVDRLSLSLGHDLLLLFGFELRATIDEVVHARGRRVLRTRLMPSVLLMRANQWRCF